MIRYTTELSDISPQMLIGFFVGWPNPPSSQTHYRILARSAEIVLAVDDEKDQVVGFVTAISDGVLSAYIPFLEVLPRYQHRGIGTELIKRLLAQLRDIYMVDLLCDQEVQPFYLRCGLNEAVGMMARNYSNQSGAGLNKAD